MEKLVAQKTEKHGKISGQKLTEKATAPQKPPPPARKPTCRFALLQQISEEGGKGRKTKEERERERERGREK